MQAVAQPGWFIDGYHGGIWGHYPRGYTGFIVEQLQKHPAWKINLEIEPVTWDVARQDDPLAYKALQELLRDTSVARRVEYVNPSFGQSYLYNISGESIIRQFSYGIKKLRQHFPNIPLETYSSEEPCFTSALPQILRSFGFKYASLKNPNTCWGGYTRAVGGELVRWIGPDGSWLYTAPRYGWEALEKNSTWQTIAWNNNPLYLQSPLAIGMCLQDAGWRNGPWLGEQARYSTWQQYFNQVADTGSATDLKLSQEDVLVSLTWGGQALQRIAQQVRHAEDKLVATEKILAMAALQGKGKWPQAAIDEAWENLLLAQHHDCWIVPYNGWINKVKRWTGRVEQICDSLVVMKKSKPVARGPRIQQTNGITILETDLYRIVVDSTIRSLVSKSLKKEWVKGNAFNYLPGVKYHAVTIIENGVQLNGNYRGHPLRQTIKVYQGQARIDCSVTIDWQHNISIGESYPYHARDYKKAFYNDREKLILLFPVNLAKQTIYKNAPFDVTTSTLDSTYFTTWDSIKNNVVLNWVDVNDGKYGMALFVDHTTAYVHSPLGLVVQYSGKGLFNMDYTLEGPTTINYSLLPHAGLWDKAGLEAERVQLAEPFPPATPFRFSRPGWELSALVIDGNDLLVRVYNAAAPDTTVKLHTALTQGQFEELDGRQGLPFSGIVTAPRFGFRTIRFHDVIKH